MGSPDTQGVEELTRELRHLEGRDWQLWSIGLLVLLLVAGGFLALILPNVMWRLGELRVYGRYLPQLFFGFISLIILFNIYVVQQRRILRNTREELVRQLIRSEAAERLSLLDPLTGVFNRRYLEEILPKEINRAQRRESSLAVVMIDVDGFKAVNTRFGHLVGDRVLKEVAELLKKNFRVSDTVIRYGGDEFLVLTGDTDEAQARVAVERLHANVEEWNRANVIPDFRLSLSCGVAAYSKGAKIDEILETADQRMYQDKIRSSPLASTSLPKN